MQPGLPAGRRQPEQQQQFGHAQPEQHAQKSPTRFLDLVKADSTIPLPARREQSQADPLAHNDFENPTRLGDLVSAGGSASQTTALTPPTVLNQVSLHLLVYDAAVSLS